jgi:transposase
MEEAMAKYKHYDYSQRILVPVSLEEQLMPGTLEFAIHTLVETRIDMSIFEHRYNNDETGRWAYDPKILLKIVLLGYARGLISSRKIERACWENVTFMALTCEQCPDHSTIAAFVSSMHEERNVLLVCDEEGLLGGTMFALDGSKLPSNASKEWSGTVSDLRKKQEKIEKKVEHLLKQQVEADKRDDADEKSESSSGLLNREKQIERLKKKAQQIEKFLKENGAKIGRRGKEIKSNITDNDSATMFTSHGTIQGYNGQALVDAKEQVIVHAEAFGEGQDHHHIAPMVDGAKENMEAVGHGADYFEGKKLAADSNYHSPPNLNKCEEEDLDAYIPKRDPRFATQKRHGSKKTERFGLEDFQHNEVTDKYICPQGKALKRWGKEEVLDGVIYKRYAAARNDCKVCEVRLRCIKGQKSKQKHLRVPVGRVPGSPIQVMAEKIDTEQGRDIYNKRIGIVEPVFANIRFQKRLDRFWLRGKTKVNIQWLLYCMVHNIGKIMRYGFA